MDRDFYVYILTNAHKTTLYIGVTSNLRQRVWQHRSKAEKGFTQRYNVDRLVYFEKHESAYSALTREKQMKKWRRAWKEELIEVMNPEWRDMFEGICV